ncbi:hypothetical protein GCM10007391_18880 [Alteromonas halophila]|uniref:Uncharacterized protein n=1 Tax=Alteromonas halophila TaxID=516698 RepID=A0A918JKU8_9ALTE|nr:hypothetical protein GCM10007391_18880 [Alteromonas halophila]
MVTVTHRCYREKLVLRPVELKAAGDYNLVVAYADLCGWHLAHVSGDGNGKVRIVKVLMLAARQLPAQKHGVLA